MPDSDVEADGKNNINYREAFQVSKGSQSHGRAGVGVFLILLNVALGV